MRIKERIEKNPIIFFLTVLVSGFLAGIATYQGILKIANLSIVPSAKVEHRRLAIDSRRLESTHWEFIGSRSNQLGGLVFLPNNKLIMYGQIGARAEQQHLNSWELSGSKIVLHYLDNTVVHEGSFTSDNSMNGTANDKNGQSWTWRAEKRF